MLFPKKTNAETSTLKDVRNAITTQLGNTDPGSDEHRQLLQDLKLVCELINQDKTTWSFKPSADVLINGAISLISIAAILRHEQFNVITSKAMSFLPKLVK